MHRVTIEDDTGDQLRYDELLRVPALSVLRTPAHDAPAVPGAVLYVPAGEEHRFVEIEEPLDVLVLFAPAEHSRREPEA